MAMDGTAVAALVRELNESLMGTRVDKVYQPEHDELHLTFRGGGEPRRLLLTANPSVMRVCFTEQTKPNPMTPPMFCMLLRKHIQGGRFVGASQPGFERILKLDIESYDELGDLTVKSLYAELMGRHSNLILVDSAGRVADSIKRVDFSVSSVRQVLPGLPYEMPPGQGKQNPMEARMEDILSALQQAHDGAKSDQFFVQTYTGISPLIAREISFRALGDTTRFLGELDYAARLDLATVAYRLFSDVREGRFAPCHIQDKQSGKLIDFSVLPITQYGAGADILPQPGVSAAIEGFYLARDRKERMAHRSAQITKLLANHMERCAKKIILQQKELADTKNKEKYRRYGELLTANLYRIEQGAKAVQVEDYYDAACPLITIPLDTRLTPAQNAQRYFTKYNKAKSAETAVSHQLALATAELEYLESMEEALSLAQSEEDLAELRAELTEQGYLRRAPDAKKKKDAPAQPMEFETSDGFRVLVGKNNKQNDQLTLKAARNNDLWFHTKGFHGSHAILKYEYETEFSETAILECAALAAYFSKAQGSANVPVDYTEVRNVKKPSGAKPGMVIYDNYNTVYVTPSEELTQRLRKK